MKKIITIYFMLFTFFCLTACETKDDTDAVNLVEKLKTVEITNSVTENINNEPTNTQIDKNLEKQSTNHNVEETTIIPEKTEKTEKTEKPEKSEKPEDPEIIRTDVENLVEVHIKNGEAEVNLNAARFDELYDYSNVYESEIDTRTHKIVGTSSKVKDACIAQIPKLDFWKATDFTAPTIFLLMEDGTVEWVHVDFYTDESQTAEFRSSGPLIWLYNIEELVYENNDEGIGEMTVFAENEYGFRFDLQLIAGLHELCAGPWICDIDSSNLGNSYTNDYYAVLSFNEDGTLIYEKGWLGDDNFARYTGTYEISVISNIEQKPGILTFDLQIDPAFNIINEAEELHGSYFIDIQNFNMFSLYHSDGDYLHSDSYMNLEYGDFWLSYNPFINSFDNDD